jgi:hypothetical protein
MAVQVITDFRSPQPTSIAGAQEKEPTVYN